MDLADMICTRAQEIKDIEQREKQLIFNISVNTQYNNIANFKLLHDNTLEYKESHFVFTKRNVSMIINEIMKSYYMLYKKPVYQLYVYVHNNKRQIFNTRLPSRIKPTLKEADMYKFDMKMDVPEMYRVFKMLWRYIKQFKHQC